MQDDHDTSTRSPRPGGPAAPRMIPWGAGAVAVLVVAGLVILAVLQGPFSLSGDRGSPFAPTTPSTTTITVHVPILEKAIVGQAMTVMTDRLRALGIGNVASAAGDDLTFTFVLPPSVDPADVEAVLHTPGNCEWLAWSAAPWPAEGDPVPKAVLPLFAPDQVRSATVRQGSNGMADDMVISFGPIATEAIAVYTAAHVGEAAMPLAMDGRIVLAPTIAEPITAGELATAPGPGSPVSLRALAAILASGPLPAGWAGS